MCADAKELTRSNAELQAFAHTIAHDLQEPLRTISAFTEILIQKAQLDEAGKETADFIVSGVRRMSILLDDLLSSATYGHGRSRGRVKLEFAAGQAMQNLRAILSSSHASVRIQPLPAVEGNECDLIRLFQNLLGNAVKYRGQAPVEIDISAERYGPDWVIRVRDNGIGIAKEQHPRVFDLFTRLHTETIPGSGIGLAACKKIVENMGGVIWVESEVGGGSTFCFTLAGGHPSVAVPRS